MWNFIKVEQKVSFGLLSLESSPFRILEGVVDKNNLWTGLFVWRLHHAPVLIPVHRHHHSRSVASDPCPPSTPSITSWSGRTGRSRRSESRRSLLSCLRLRRARRPWGPWVRLWVLRRVFGCSYKRGTLKRVLTITSFGLSPPMSGISTIDSSFPEYWKSILLTQVFRMLKFINMELVFCVWFGRVPRYKGRKRFREYYRVRRQVKNLLRVFDSTERQKEEMRTPRPRNRGVGGDPIVRSGVLQGIKDFNVHSRRIRTSVPEKPQVGGLEGSGGRS